MAMGEGTCLLLALEQSWVKVWRLWLKAEGLKEYRETWVVGQVNASRDGWLSVSFKPCIK